MMVEVLQWPCKLKNTSVELLDLRWHQFLRSSRSVGRHEIICAKESGATPFHQKLVLDSSSSDTIRTTIYTGRPLRACRNEYNVDYEENRRDRIKELESRGIVVYKNDVKTARAKGEDFDLVHTYPQYMGQAIGGITEVKSAAEIVEEFMNDATSILRQMTARL